MRYSQTSVLEQLVLEQVVHEKCLGCQTELRF